MKRILIMLLIAQGAHAQITGKLVKTDGTPLQGANVLLLKDTTLVAEVITDSLGEYKFEAPKGTYEIRASALGYHAWESKPFKAPKDQGTQTMQERATQLNEVVIKAQKPPFQQSPYGITVNAESSLLNPGSTILEILQRSPGVVLDPQHSGISLNGKSDVTVMINGRLTHLPLDQVFQMLSSMSGDDLDHIELMSTPPANYDAAGSGGIINIVLKKSRKKGNSGSFTLSGGTGWGEKGSAGARFEHHTGKVDLYGSYSIYHDHSRGWLDAWGSEIEPLIGGACTFLYHGDFRNINNSQTVEVGIDVQADSKTLVSAGLLYDVNHGTSISDNRASYMLPDSALNFMGQITGTSRNHNPLASLYVERTFHKDERLKLELDGIDYTTNSPTAILSTFLDSKGVQYQPGDTTFSPVQNGYSTSEIKVGVIKADYTRTITQHVSLEAGFKGDYTRSISNAGILSEVNGAWVPRDGTTTDILMHEYIDAGYVSLHLRIDSNTNLIAGLRYEASRTRADSVNTPINALFPDIFFTHKNWTLGYTTRISRPSYTDLASYIGYNDPISVFTGNPFLKPTLTHNLKLGYNQRGYGLSLLYTHDIDPIVRYQVTARPGSELVYIAPENLPYENTVELEAIAPLRLRSWWTLNVYLAAYWRQYRVDFVPNPFTEAYLSWSANATSSWTISKTWSAEVSGYFNSLSYNSTGTSYPGGQVNVGIKKDLGVRGSLQLAATDPLRLNHYRGYIGDLTQDSFDSKVHIDYQPETRIFPIIKLTYRRTFGSDNSNKRGRGSVEDERSRL